MCYSRQGNNPKLYLSSAGSFYRPYIFSQTVVIEVGKLNKVLITPKIDFLSVCLTTTSLTCFVSQLIAAYSTPPAPPAPPETSEFASDSASASLDFKDSDMKRLSMEIERERCVCLFFLSFSFPRFHPGCLFTSCGGCFFFLSFFCIFPPAGWSTWRRANICRTS